MEFNAFLNNCMEIENPLTDAILCGKILLHTKEWDISFICDFCHRNMSNLSELLRHALTRHVEDVPQDKLKELCNADKIHNVEFNEIPESLDDPKKEEEQEAVEEYKLECDFAIESVEDAESSNDVSSLQHQADDFETKSSNLEFESLNVDTKTIVVRPPTGKPKKLQCKICTAKFEFIYQFKNHLKTHGVKPFACKECGASFAQNSKLKEHNLRHLGIKPHACTICQKAFTSAPELKCHMRTHTGERPFKCAECDKTFRGTSQLSSHRRQQHINERTNLCPICGKGFVLATKLTEHIKTHSSERPHKCTECDASFKLRKGLRQHMLIHSDVKKYSCKICDKRFAQHAGVASHMKTAHKNGKS